MTGPEDQPDDDIHGECRHEIERLEQQLAALRIGDSDA